MLKVIFTLLSTIFIMMIIELIVSVPQKVEEEFNNFLIKGNKKDIERA